VSNLFESIVNGNCLPPVKLAVFFIKMSKQDVCGFEKKYSQFYWVRAVTVNELKLHRTSGALHFL